MIEKNTNTQSIWTSKLFIIAVAVVVLFTIFMYFRDRKLQQVYEIRRLETRVEALEDVGRPRQNNPRQWR